MLSLVYIRAALALSILSIPVVQAQLVPNLPQCVQDCINQSPDTNCAVTNIGCICRASAGNFLSDVITCMHGNCDNDLDTNLFLTPLQLACMIAGAPIPASAIRNAQNQASSLASQVTTTVTMGGSSASGGTEVTTTVASVSVSVSSVTLTTAQSGTTEYWVYPITVQNTKTVTGPTSTLTSLSTATPSSGFTGVIPVIIVGTNSAGSTYTSTTTQPGVISTYKTTDSRGSTTTQTSTYTSTASTQSSESSSSTSSASSESTSLTTTTVAAAQTSSSSTPASRTSKSPDPNQTNSAPFKDTNSSAASRSGGKWFWTSIGLVMACIWA